MGKNTQTFAKVVSTKSKYCGQTFPVIGYGCSWKRGDIYKSLSNAKLAFGIRHTNSVYLNLSKVKKGRCYPILFLLKNVELIEK